MMTTLCGESDISAGRLEVLVDHLLERTLVDESYDLIDDLAALEEHHGRDTAHHIAHGRAGVVVHVELAHRDLADVIGGQLRNRRLHRPAWPTPFRPEIDEHGRRGLEHVAVEVAVGKRLEVFGCHDACTQSFQETARSPRPRLVAASRARLYTLTYSFADVCQEWSVAMPCLISVRQTSRSPNNRTACRSVRTSAPAEYVLSLKPLARRARTVYGCTVSSRPPTGVTTGTVPYRRLYI